MKKIYISLTFMLLLIVFFPLKCIIKTSSIDNSKIFSTQIDNFNIKNSLWVEDNLSTIKKTIKFYKKNYSDCTSPIEVTFLDVNTFMNKGKVVTGLATWNDPFKINKILVAVQDRALCNIIVTYVHEMRHICENLDDCYDTWNDGCWAKDLADQTDLICINVLTTVED